MFLSTKKYSHNLKIKLFHLVGMFSSLSPGDNISVALRKLLQGVRRGSQAVYKFATKGACSLTSKIRYQVKEFNILCMGRCKPLGSLNSFFSYDPHLSGATEFIPFIWPQLSGANSVALFTLLLAFPQLLSNHPGGVAGSAGLQLWGPSFTFGGQKSLMAVTFLVD